jgi:hypothetical protein
MITTAFCKEINTYINIENYNPEIHKSITCKNLHPLIAKRGTTLKHHFAHYQNTACQNKSPWHISYQNLFEKTEVPFSNSKHIADIVHGDTVIEIQHSNIKKEDIESREETYDNMIWIFDVKNSVTGTEFLCRDDVGKCIVKLNRKCLFETSKPTYYDCGKYLLRKISLHGKYALCEIVEYRDFAKSIEYRDCAKFIDVSEKEFIKFDSLVTDRDFDFSFQIDTLQYRCGKIFFESNEKDTNFYPFLESKYVTNRFFLPF